MAEITDDQNTGLSLWDALTDENIKPGHNPGYELCKLIAVSHPLGHKITCSPIEQVLQKKPTYVIDTETNTDIIDEFQRTWDNLGCDEAIKQCAINSRVYGAASIVVGATRNGEVLDSSIQLDRQELADCEVFLNVFDPLPTSGSLTINQNPDSPDYLKAPKSITAGGRIYPSGRFCLLLNQVPIYLAWTASAFGFSGRSAFAQIIYDLGTYLSTLKSIRMVAEKSGVLVAKFKQTSSQTDQIQAGAIDRARNLLKQSRNGDVFSVSESDSIESLNLQNVDSSLTVAIEQNIKTIAAGAGMPAVMLNSEAFAHGFSGGEQDAIRVSAYLMERREWMAPLYRFLQNLVMKVAWSDDFINLVKMSDPSRYEGRGNETIFQEWCDNFRADWPSMIEEPVSERQEAGQRIFARAVQTWEALSPSLDAGDRSRLMDWVVGAINESGLFHNELYLNLEQPPDASQEETVSDHV